MVEAAVAAAWLLVAMLERCVNAADDAAVDSSLDRPLFVSTLEPSSDTRLVGGLSSTMFMFLSRLLMKLRRATNTSSACNGFSSV